MKPKQQKLLELMLENDQIMSSRMLSQALHISSRTVINYINEINEQSDETIVFSSKNGYWLNQKKALEFLKKEDETPQDFEQRSAYIIKLLLMEHKESLNIYALCETLYVSYSTIKNDIAKMNQLYHFFHIRFVMKNNAIHLIGEEKNKRKLMSKCIFDQHNNILNMASLEECFPDIQINKLASLIANLMNKYHYYVNDFSRMNLIIHYAIVIDRMKNGHYIAQQDTIDLPLANATEKAMVDDLIQALTLQFDISLSQEEIIEFLILIRTNAQKTEIEQLKPFKDTMDHHIIEYVDALIYKVNEMFYIDLNDDQFIIPFSIHVKNLLNRLSYGTTIKNPLVKSIKELSPILFDIAVYIGKDIQDYFHIHQEINAHEIGFIAIHVGAQIERQNNNISKINVILVCPDYIQLASSIRNKLLYNLGTKINIIDTLSDLSNEIETECEAIISTINITQKTTLPLVMISPFVSESDISKVYELLSQIKDRKNLEILKNDFDYYFHEHNFIYMNEGKRRDEVIHLMAETLLKNGYVDEQFEQKVFIRENSSPTSFTDFAIPHSFEMDAKQTGICLLIDFKGIAWGEQHVSVVMMIAMNKKDNVYFYQLYEAIITLLSHDISKQLLRDVVDFTSFKNVIFSLYKKFS